MTRALAVLLLWLLLAILAAPVPGAAQAEQPPGPQTDVASYQLAAVLDQVNRRVRGSGRIIYRNPSSDTLEEVWLRLYLNAFRSPNTQWMREAGESFRGLGFDPSYPGWIRVDELALADTGQPLPLPGGGDTEDTVVRVPLPAPLPPDGKLVLHVRWTAQLPKVFARTGFADDFFMVGQWYPKLAVYDRGRWDTEPWHANSEFFADFGSYDLEVTLPAHFVTGASGVRLGETYHADGTKTVRYRAERVTDVAWTAWPSFRVINRAVMAAAEAVQIELLVPPDEEPMVERHLAIAHAALDSYGRWYGPYPWPKLTVVVPPRNAAGAGGMEYPTLVVTGASARVPAGLGPAVRELEVVTAHEIAHQWFPMQVQSNEAADPWLDEGFADYMTIRLLERLYGRGRSLVDLPVGHLGYDAVHRASFVALAARQPLAQPAWHFPNQALYAATAYSKGSLALLSLERTLGDDRFTAALRAYADAWRWRHPTIPDFQAALQQSSGEDLGWFFSQYVHGSAVADYKAVLVSPGQAIVQRTGDGTFPVEVRVRTAGGDVKSRVWDGSEERLELDAGPDEIIAVEVDPGERIAIELDRLDNTRLEHPPQSPALAIANRWLAAVQAVLQLLARIG